MAKDQLLMRSMQAAAGFHPRGRSKGRGTPRGTGRGYQGQRWNSYQGYQNFAPRGPPRGRGRGFTRPRGRGASHQPFSDPQSFTKKE